MKEHRFEQHDAVATMGDPHVVYLRYRLVPTNEAIEYRVASFDHETDQWALHVGPEGEGVDGPFAAVSARPAGDDLRELEIRHDIEDNDDWRAVFGKRSERFKDHEMIVRFFALLFYAPRYERPMKVFINRYMATNRNLEKQDEATLREAFEPTIGVLRAAKGDRVFRLGPALNAAVFDSVMTGVARRLATCAGLSPAQIIQRMRSDGQGQSGHGFAGDPGQPVSGRYFGYLGWAGAATPDSTPPAIASVSPADGQTGVAAAASVTVAFSEPMDKPATEAAFALARTSDGARVAGSFSWNANTMTFRSSAPLGQATQYTAKVGARAKDVAGNALGAERAWSFKTLATVTASPAATVIEAGTLRAGTYGRLGADDNVYYEVNSTASGTRTSSWYGRFTGVSNALKALRVTYKGKSSATCTQTVALWRWTTSSWVSLDSRSVGTTEALIDKSPSGTLADYVSPNGELRARVRCTRSSGFYSRGDLLRISYDRP